MNRHRPDGARLAFFLSSTYCDMHKAHHFVLRGQCHACLKDKIVGAVNEAVHPDCAIPEVLRALGMSDNFSPENVRELARVYVAAQAFFALDGLRALLQLMRRK